MGHRENPKGKPSSQYQLIIQSPRIHSLSELLEKNDLQQYVLIALGTQRRAAVKQQKKCQLSLTLVIVAITCTTQLAKLQN